VPWLMFFFQYAAVGIYSTFLNVYYKQIGLSGAQIGLMGMAAGIIAMISTFSWSYLADRSGQPRKIIVAGALGGLLVAQLIPLVTFARLAHPFGWYLLIGCLFSFMISALFSLVDGVSLSLLGERRQAYGRYRLGGTVGYVLAAVLAGFIYDRAGYLVMFPAYGLLMLIFALVTLRLPQSAVRLQGTGRREIGQMIRQPVWLVLMGSIFLFWIAYNASLTFTGVILKSMGASDQVISFAMVIGAVIEIPFMAFSGGLIQRFGPARLIWFALVLQIIRFYLLAQMDDPAWAIAINILNGPGYVLLWNSAINLVSLIAPRGLAATAQSFLNMTISLASIISSLMSGVLFDYLGPNGLFLVLAGFCLAAFLLFGFGIVLRPQTKISAAG